jgi:MoaA/NifB/PqqE/SkfB family radical SAM enzyme
MKSAKLSTYFLLRKVAPVRRLQAAVREYQRISNLIKYGDYHFFREVNIEISAHCNRRCNYCPQSVSPLPTEFMSREVFLAILNRLKEIGWRGPVGYAHFNEPMLDKRLTQFVRLTKQVLPDSLPHLYTNGDCLNPARAQELIDAGVVNFAVTRHDNDFEDWNRRIVPLAKMFPDHFTLVDLHGLELSSRGGLIQDPAVRIQKMYRCDAPEASLHISTIGNAMLCCCDYTHDHTFGNVVPTPILEIWRGKEFKRVRDEVRAGRPRLNICKGCFRDPDFKPQ